MTESARKIYDITEKLLFSPVKKDAEYILELFDFFTSVPIQKDHQGDISLKNGIALSNKNASDCIKDYKRTATFLRGTYKSIIECAKRFPSTQLNILYAGCGPYATLIVPLLSFFEPKNITVTLIDINQSSITSVKNLISKLGYEDYISDIIVADATQFQHPKNTPLHIVITETMFHALTKEPQVAITQNLASQLTEGGFLVPEEITIYLGYSFFSKEPYLNQYDDIYQIANSANQNIKREATNKLFSLNKNERTNQKNLLHFFESKWHLLPENYEETPDICIYTHIKVFDTLQLQDADSLITNPYCLVSLYNLQDRSKFKIKYNTQNVPNWEITVS